MIYRSLAERISALAPDRVFFFVDPASGFDFAEAAAMLGAAMPALPPAEMIRARAGEEHKTPAQVGEVLSALSRGGATRQSLLVCVGGGVTTDLGGFAAAVFKRGMRYGNVSTTILGAVDAAVGGKTGVNFMGLKNEVGAFHFPSFSLPDIEAMAGLPRREVLSGFGEVVKCVFIGFRRFLPLVGVAERAPADDALGALLGYCAPDMMEAGRLEALVGACVALKEDIVGKDPRESGLRKVLNFGHTAGHALEELAIARGMASGVSTADDAGSAHGVAVAHGILIALILSERMLGLPRRIVSVYARWLRGHYPPLPVTCADYPRLWQLGRHDKKNSASDDTLRFVLLRGLGSPEPDIPVGRVDFEAALDLYQELQGR